MPDILEYEFMQRAFIVGGLLALILPCMGQLVLLKRISMIGDTLSHSSLAGLTIGLAFGFSPILAAIIACLVAGLSIELIRNKLKAYQEISTVIILAASIGLAGIFSSMVKNTNAISSYLFGSIVTISEQEFYLVIGVAIFVIMAYISLYKSLYLTIFDPQAAKIMGINVKLVNIFITFLTAIAVSISAKTIGSLIVSSILVIPSISAMQYTKTYKATLLLSIGFSIIFVFLGLIISYYLDLKPGSVIVLISVVWLIISLFIKKK